MVWYMEFSQDTAMDSSELAENMIAFVLVEDDILRELQDGKDPTDYLIRNLQPSVVPLLRPVQHFSTAAPTLQSYSYVPGIFSDDCNAAATVNGHYPQASNFTFTNYIENPIRTHLTHSYTSNRPLPVPVPVPVALEKPRRKAISTKPKVEEPLNSHSGRDNFGFPPMWVMADDEPFVPWVDSDRNNRGGIGTGCDKLKLTKLPCCNEYASEMTCISSKIVPQRPSSVSTDMEFDQQDGRFQNQLLKTCEEYDEIQNQLKAICFSKPEMLTSTATLAYINTSKSMGTFDDLLRRCCNFQNNDVTASGTASLDLDKENEALPNANKCSLPQQRKSRGRKPLKQAWGTNYIPRSPLPFERVFDLSSLPIPSSSVSCHDQELGRHRKVLHDDLISCESAESGWTVGSSDSVSSSSGSFTYASGLSHFNVAKKKKRNFGSRVSLNNVSKGKGKGKGPATSSFKTIGTTGMGFSYSNTNYFKANVTNNFKKPKSKFYRKNEKMSIGVDKSISGSGVSTISELTTFPEETESSTNNVPTAKNAGSTTTILPALISTPKQESPFEWLDTYFSSTNSKNESESWDMC